MYDNEELIAGLEEKIRERVTKEGYSISAGYEVRDAREDLNEVIRKSDSRMYEDKAYYYSEEKQSR